MKKKFNRDLVILASSTAPQSVVIGTADKEDFAIGLKYGAGTSTTAKLQSSTDGVNYVDITDPDSRVTLSNAGSTEVWNIVDYSPSYIKLVITGDAVTCVATLNSD